MSERLDRIGLFFALFVFLLLGSLNLSLPGLHYDEAREAGLNAMEFLRGLPITAFRNAQLHIGSVSIPLMVQDYIGALNVFLAIPFLGAFGIRVEALRLFTLSVGAGTIFLTWSLARKLGGPLAGFGTAILLAFNPSFVFWSRQGIFVTNIVPLFLVASLLCALRWREKCNPRDLYCLALLWGLGVYSKAIFLWAILAMVLLALVLPNRRLPPPKELAFASIAFLLPLTPLLLFNALTGGTILAVAQNLRFSYYGINNLALGANLAARLKQLITLLRGDHLWYLGGIFSNPVAPWVAGGFVLVTLLLALAGRAQWRALLPAGIIGFIVVESAFTISGLFITHYFLLLPLLAISGGVGFGLLLKKSSSSRILKALAVVAFILWASRDLYITALYHRALAATGGHSAHSNAVYELAHHLLCWKGNPVIALDWGIDAPLRFLTLGEVKPVEIFGYESFHAPDAGFRERASLFLNPGTIFIAHGPEDTVFKGRVEALESLAEEKGLKLEEIAHFRERSGRLLYIILQLR